MLEIPVDLCQKTTLSIPGGKMPVSIGNNILIDEFLTAIDAHHAAPTDPALKAAAAEKLENLLEAVRKEAHAEIAQESASRKADVKTRVWFYGAAIGLIPASFLIGYHFLAGPVTIAHRMDDLETMRTTTMKNVDVLIELTRAHSDRLDEQEGFIQNMWPDHDHDNDGVVDRLDRCANTQHDEETLENEALGCSIDQAAWLCLDLPAVPAGTTQFQWSMKYCPVGMLQYGQQVTCTFTTDATMTALTGVQDCQVR